MWIIFPRETVKREEKEIQKEPLGTLALWGEVMLRGQGPISENALRVAMWSPDRRDRC